MAIAEIKLDVIELEQKLSDVSNQAATLEVSPLGVDILSRSDAMEKFISLYGEYGSVMEEYLSALTQDLERIKLAAHTLENKDSSLAEQFLTKQ